MLDDVIHVWKEFRLQAALFELANDPFGPQSLFIRNLLRPKYAGEDYRICAAERLAELRL